MLSELFLLHSLLSGIKALFARSMSATRQWHPPYIVAIKMYVVLISFSPSFVHTRCVLPLLYLIAGQSASSIQHLFNSAPTKVRGTFARHHNLLIDPH